MSRTLLSRGWAANSACAALLLSVGCGTTVPDASRALARDDLTGTGGGLPASAPAVNQGTSDAIPGVSTTTGGGSGLGKGGSQISPGSTGGSVDGSGRPGRVTPGTTSRQPIQVGVLITDTASYTKATGVGESASILTRDSLHAYIKAINAAGGVAGRKLTVVDVSMNFSAQSWDNEFEAACQTFTVDNHVGAVIYDGTVYNQNFNTCLTKAGVPAFYMGRNGTQVGDATDFANYPGMITTSSPSVDRRLRSILNGAIAQRFLRSGSKLGVFVETCPYNLRAYDRVLAPIVARNKITVNRQDIECSGGAAAQQSGPAAVASAVLRFKTEGVDSVLFDSNFENGLWFYFAATAEQQQYRPQYLLFHNQGCSECLAAGRSSGLEGQFAGLKGFGGLPLGEVTYPPSPPAAQAAARRTCLSTAKSQSVTFSGPVQQMIVLDSCDAVNLLRRALTLSGGLAGTRAIVSALERLGADFVSTLTLNGATRFGPGRHDGMERTAVSVYQSKCECVTYITSPRPIP